jgi:hypothetical protein
MGRTSANFLSILANIYSGYYFKELGSSRRLKDANRAPEVPKPAENRWYNRYSPYNPDERADAEELLKLSPEVPTIVLDLAGLYGGGRSMRKRVGRIAPMKEVLKNKVGQFSSQ